MYPFIPIRESFLNSVHYTGRQSTLSQVAPTRSDKLSVGCVLATPEHSERCDSGVMHVLRQSECWNQHCNLCVYREH